MNEKIDKIVELGIDIDDMDQELFEELGVDVISLVESPAIEVDFLAFNNQEFVEPTAGESEDEFIGRCMTELDAEFPDQEQRLAVCYQYWEGEEQLKKKKKKSQYATEEEQEQILAFAREAGEPIMAEDIILDLSATEFNTIGDVLKGIGALDILKGLKINRDEPAVTRYRYQGETPQRKFCRALMQMNRLFKREDIIKMVNLNKPFGHGDGGASYSKWSYKGGPNCKHFQIIIPNGPASGNAGVAPYDMPKHGYYAQQFALDEDKRIATGPIMVPNKMILRRDEEGNPFYVYFTRKTIRKMAEKFLANSKHNNTDVEHDGQVKTENTLLETWISEDMVKDKSSMYGFTLPPGTWYASYRINSEEDWQKIKSGELRGFSLAGNFLERLKPQPQLTEDDERLEEIKKILKDVQ
jgi:hypothetical protein